MARQGLTRTPCSSHFFIPSPLPWHSAPDRSAPICLQGCRLLWGELCEVSATPAPYGEHPSSLTASPFLFVLCLEQQENGVWRKGLCCTACLWPWAQGAARTAGWTLPSPSGASGSVLNHRQVGARLPLAVPVCSELPTSEFLVGGRKEHGGDGQHL